MRARFKWLAPGEILAYYGKGRGRRKNNYRKECLGLIGLKPKFAEQLKTSAVIGPAERVKEIVERYKPGGKIKAVSAYSAAKKRNFDLRAELKRVAGLFGVAAEKLHQKHKNFPPRQVAYYHLVEHCGFSVVDTAEALSVSHTGVRLGINRLKEKMKKDRRLERRVGRLSNM